MATAKKVAQTLFIHRIPFTVGTRDLWDHFSKFGHVVRCKQQWNKETGLPMGYGWVTFRLMSSVEKAMKVEEHILDGYKVTVRQQERSTNSEEADGV